MRRFTLSILSVVAFVVIVQAAPSPESPAFWELNASLWKNYRASGPPTLALGTHPVKRAIVLSLNPDGVAPQPIVWRWDPESLHVVVAADGSSATVDSDVPVQEWIVIAADLRSGAPSHAQVFTGRFMDEPLTTFRASWRPK